MQLGAGSRVIRMGARKSLSVAMSNDATWAPRSIWMPLRTWIESVLGMETDEVSRV